MSTGGELFVKLRESAESFAAAANGSAKAGQAALELASGLDQDFGRYARLESSLKSLDLSARLIDLPLQLAGTGETELALSVARSFSFLAVDEMRGQEAVILARAGRREEALALVASNLEAARAIPVAEAKAGDVYRALGEPEAAEAYYLRALAEAREPSERAEAVVRLVSLFLDLGREGDAAAILAEERNRRAAPGEVTKKTVGRNDPCPCGSGKKYKRCHGA